MSLPGKSLVGAVTKRLFPGVKRNTRGRVFHICPDPAVVIGELVAAFHETAV